MRSIRRRLTVGLLAGLILLIATGGVALFAVLKRSLTAEFDVGLLAKVRALVTLTEEEANGEVELDFGDRYMPEFERANQPEYFEVWLEDGSVLVRSPSLETNDLPREAGTIDSPLFRDLPLPDGRRGRAVGITFVPQHETEHAKDEKGDEKTLPPSNGRQVTLVLARSRDDLDRTLQLLAFGLGGVGLLLPIGVSLVVFVMVGRGLAPLDRMGAQAASIDSSRLEHRFPVSEMPRELQPICRRLNELLERLGEAFARERRFTGDAAHELRTPIAELQSLAEVASMHPEDADLARRTVAEALSIARQMGRLVTTLLALARGEAGVEQVTFEQIEIGNLLEQAWAPLQGDAAERGLSVDWDVPPALFVECDRALLHAVLSNLLLNAVTYSPEDTLITVQAGGRSNSIHLLIANANSSLCPADLPRLFEPFWQKDPSRTDAIRSGLGLSIASTFCRLMNVGVETRLTDENRLVVELVFRRTTDAGS